ncbi:STAS-like domain-containing protein [Mesorhizobium sp. M1312]|uniref:STAS-like domain-containing protein n=1 Tax=unclassified Mesorhizobium TaxID=325217 RepID=UPI003339C667
MCVSTSDGQKVYEVVQRHVASGDRVTLSFSGISRMTTAFLNAAVGQLYNEFPEEHIRKHLAPPIDAEPWHLTRLKLVVDRAKIFFTRPDIVANAISSHAEDDDDSDI